MQMGIYGSEMSTCTPCKSLVMINWDHIMKNTNKFTNKMCCMYSVNNCGDAHRFVDVR